MIWLENVYKSYGKRVILQDLHLHLEAGEFAFLQGRSGSGKSTLLKLLYREQTDFAGRIEIDAVRSGKFRNSSCGARWASFFNRLNCSRERLSWKMSRLPERSSASHGRRSSLRRTGCWSGSGCPT
ncbi:cell division ATP-binding protein FtsE [Brevibacillus agri BAB-2500]|nr:cell division ATP-binding protein FtsE [Brevibacillus agri BAB-2500]